MSRLIPTVTVTAGLLVAACFPPPNVPPPRFKPNPPYPPEPVDPYGEVSESYDQTRDVAPPSQSPGRPDEYPVARPTDNPNQVISPFEPYNIIDVEGFNSGQLARDPSNQKIFRVP